MMFRDVAARAVRYAADGFPAPPGHARLCAQARRRVPPLARERGDLDAGWRGASAGRPAGPGRSRPHPAIPLRRGARGRRRPHGGPRCGAARVLPRRHRAPDPRPSAGARRAAHRRGPRELPLPDRALGLSPLSTSTARRSRCTPAAPGARVRSCSKRFPSPRRRAWVGRTTARTRISTRLRRPSSSPSPTGKAYLGDPDYVDVPLDTLTGSAYAAERSWAIDPAKASPGMPPPGRIPGHEPYVPTVAPCSAPIGPSPDTSIVCVIDGEGNALCSTPSDTSWDTPVVPGTGLAVSSRGAQSWAVRGHPSCVAPGKRPAPHAQPLLRALARAAGSCPSGPPAATRRSRRTCKRS